MTYLGEVDRAVRHGPQRVGRESRPDVPLLRAERPVLSSVDRGEAAGGAQPLPRQAPALLRRGARWCGGRRRLEAPALAARGPGRPAARPPPPGRLPDPSLAVRLLRQLPLPPGLPDRGGAQRLAGRVLRRPADAEPGPPAAPGRPLRGLRARPGTGPPVGVRTAGGRLRAADALLPRATRPRHRWQLQRPSRRRRGAG